MFKLVYEVTVFYRDHDVLTVLELDPLKSVFSVFTGIHSSYPDAQQCDTSVIDPSQRY